MYKAVALSDMGQNKEAIEWLKKAEHLAGSTDYLTLGLINSQMGHLYNKNYAVNSEEIEKYKQALAYYRLAGQKDFENQTLASLGNLYRMRNKDSAFYYLQQGIELSRELDDRGALLINMTRLAAEHLSGKKPQEAKNLALSALKLSSDTSLRLFCILGTSYAKMGIIDSAEYYLAQVNLTNNPGDSVVYYRAATDVAVARKDFKQAYYTEVKATEIADRVIREARKEDWVVVEKQFDYTMLQERAKYFQAQNTIKNYLIAIIALVLIGVSWTAYAVLKRRNRMVKERAQLVEQLKLEIQCQQAMLKDFENKQIASSENEAAFRELIANRVTILRKLAGIKHEYGATPVLFLRKFDEIMLDNQQSQSSANQIIEIANKLHRNIIHKISQTEPKLTQKELLILSMTCLKFRQLEMCIYLQSPSLEATYMARQRLSKKLKTRSLEDYLAQVGMDNNIII